MNTFIIFLLQNASVLHIKKTKKLILQTIKNKNSTLVPNCTTQNFTGMIAGYIIYRFKQPPKVSFTFNIVMWFVSMLILSLCVFGIWNGTLDRIDTAFYISLGHTGKNKEPVFQFHKDCRKIHRFLRIFFVNLCESL